MYTPMNPEYPREDMLGVCLEDSGADTGEQTELTPTKGEPLFRLVYVEH